MLKHTILALALLSACGSKSNTSTTPADPMAACPANIPTAVATAFPGSTQKSCESEMEGGKQQYEVEIAKADGTESEVHLAPDGTIIKEEPDND